MKTFDTFDSPDITGAYTVLREMTAKRRDRWKDQMTMYGYSAALAYDQTLTEAAARKILSDTCLVEAVRNRPWMLVEVVFTIVTKEGKTVPFFYNEVQRRIVATMETEIAEASACGESPRPFYILKGRQQGVTSFVTALQLAAAITRRNFSGMTLADTGDNTAEIFKSRARAVLERLPSVLRPAERYNNAKELYFDKLNSTWRAQTATDEVGRSRTLSMCHFSEIATYSCRLSTLQASVGQAIAAGALIFYETTANGFGEARTLWMAGSCVNLFFPWWLSDEYRCSDTSMIERCAEGDAWLTERCNFLQKQGLDRTQIAWYCRKYNEMLDKSKMRQEYPCYADEAFIFSGTSLFDTESVSRALADALQTSPLRRGRYTYRKVRRDITDRDGHVTDEEWKLEDIRFVDSPDGMITIHESPRVLWDDEMPSRIRRPVGFAPYVIGGDTAGKGEDYYTAKVVDNQTGRTAATLRVQTISDDLYAEQVLCLAYEYHMATIGIETNFSTHPTRVIGQTYGYPYLYLRERFDKLTDEIVQEPGFQTTPKTKPIIIGELQTDLRDDPRADPDPATLSELLTFVRHENGSMGAVAGAHDDLVMALAIAHHIGSQAPRIPFTQKPGLPSDISTAYHAASPYTYPDELEAAEIESYNHAMSGLYEWNDL